jgi:hypothetical protein
MAILHSEAEEAYSALPYRAYGHKLIKRTTDSTQALGI